MSRIQVAVAALVCAALAGAYARVGWWVIFEQRFGPVVAVLDARRGRGVHSGDLLGLAAWVTAAGCLLAAVWLVAELLDGSRVRTAHRR